MAIATIFDPTARRDDDIASIGRDAGVLTGKRIGFRVDQIWRAWDWISDDWAARLRAAGCETSVWRSTDRSGAEGDRMVGELKAWLATLDVVVLGLANCGSCTGWTIRDSITAANAGVPTVAIATKNFEDFAHEIAERGGRSGLRVYVLPYPLNEREKGSVINVAETHFAGMLKALGAQIEEKQAA